MNIMEVRAKEILAKLDGFLEMPASLSGRHHHGETMQEHLTRAVEIIKNLCREFNVTEADTDMLVAAGWLHDIGRWMISEKGKITTGGWKYYEATGWSSNIPKMVEHPVIGAKLLERYDISRKKELQRLISVHMSHWYPNQPQPDTCNLYEVIVCTADYLASRGK